MKMSVVALDLGFRQTKIVTGRNNYIFPSLIGNPSIFEIDEFYTAREITNDLELIYENETYYVGSRAQDTTNARLCTNTDKTDSVNEKVIYRACLGIISTEHDKTTNVSVVTGLPVEDFKQKGLKDQLISNMAGQHRFIFRGEQCVVNVKEVIVIPQSAGAYYDYVLDSVGKIKREVCKLAGGTVIVIDVGYKTTDIVTMINGSYDSRRSFTMEKGMRDIHKELNKMIRFVYNRKFSLYEMDNLCRTAIMPDNGHMIDIRDLINKSTKPIAEAILTEINATIGDTRTASKILGTGGTIVLLNDYFKQYYGEIYECSEQAELSNARGYEKYGLMYYENNNKN